MDSTGVQNSDPNGSAGRMLEFACAKRSRRVTRHPIYNKYKDPIRIPVNPLKTNDGGTF
jgi:hypothetical protein